MIRDTRKNRKPVRKEKKGRSRGRFRITRLEARIAPAQVPGAPGNSGFGKQQH